ncbi:hypothetical protein I302_106156 [Kwoniella bestiolae CBS 10118]|uniref:F-box domain-containing protein n=1 Tax=Kwoniella bestiolae CBS 10118 TaxID=1296100 RepID=A0A1B9G360_9TREE|nr:hypothetical protein I302_05279 [Kwoniella bestiolae CBS 10118]OCF25459.1 hypothetical protein I302_05279 [Kwoniella bestiolae CBS 10118]
MLGVSPSPAQDDAFYEWYYRCTKLESQSPGEMPALGRLLACEEYSGLAEGVLEGLNACDLIKCSQVSKHLNHLISYSSLLQLKLRYAFHQHSFTSSNVPISAGEKLRELLSFERNLHYLSPSEVYSIPTKDSLWTIILQDRLFTGYPQGEGPVAWEMYDLEGREGPRKMICARHDAEVLSRIMLPGRNLLVHVTEIGDASTHHDPNIGKSFRIHFYLLDPSSDDTPNTWQAIYHPEASHPYIDIGPFPPNEIYCTPIVACGLSDRLMFLVGNGDGSAYGWVGLLDWREGKLIGCIVSPFQIEPSSEVDMIDDHDCHMQL